MNYLWQKFLVELKYHNRIILYEFSIIHCGSASSTFLHGLSGRNMLNLFDMLNHASTTQKTICSFELSLFSSILTSVYQLIVRIGSKPSYSGMTRRNKLQYLIHFQDWVKVVVLHRSKCQSSFCSVLPWTATLFMPGIS